MVDVDARFHDLITADTPQTRCRIFFIADTVDCTDDEDVQTNGSMLVSDMMQSDSNSVIGQNGWTIDEYFNQDSNVMIGDTVSSIFNCTFINSTSALDNFQFGRCKIYLEVFDSDEQEWLSCPMGVYIIDTPVKRKVQLISVTAYDQMQMLDQNADNWWNALDFSEGLNLYQIFTSMCAAVGVRTNQLSITNGTTYTYTTSPFESVEHTYRDILAWIAGAACSIARFDRNGYLTLKFFGTVNYDISIDVSPTTCLAYDQAEYDVSVIDALQVSASATDIGVIIGAGSNAYRLVDNGFMYGSTDEEIRPRATNIYNALNSLGSYRPTELTVIADPSVESGDVITFTSNSESYKIPIFQQKLSWRGGFVRSQLYSQGDAELPTLNAVNRAEFRSNKAIHELEITVEQFRSLIQDMRGNYSLIQQTVNSIEQVVADQGVSISDILDPSGEMWTAITSNTANIETIGESLIEEVTERKSYIRFIPAEPAIVLGVDTDSEIKLKMTNGIIYFFSGDDDSTNLSNAYAWFNSESAFATKMTADKALEIGAENDDYHWIWRKLENEDLVLDMI